MRLKRFPHWHPSMGDSAHVEDPGGHVTVLYLDGDGVDRPVALDAFDFVIEEGGVTPEEG